MAIGGYERKDPVVYAAQRGALALRVRDGMAVRAAARLLNIPYSTAWLWAAQDGLRKADRAADAAGEPRPPPGYRAKPGRGRAAAEAGGLPVADYPELKGLGARKRLTTLASLAGTAQMRAVAAIEEGCIAYAMSSLAEAQRLQRAWRTLRDWLEQYPEPEEVLEADDWHDEIEEMIRAHEEGREPVRAPPAPLDPEEEAIWAAIHAAEAEALAEAGKTRGDFTDDELVLHELDLAQEFQRIVDARARWMSLPGRAPPPIVVRLPKLRGWGGL